MKHYCILLKVKKRLQIYANKNKYANMLLVALNENGSICIFFISLHSKNFKQYEDI
jgi:hypothetical protein